MTLTQRAREIVQSRVAAPVIIEAHPDRFETMVGVLQQRDLMGNAAQDVRNQIDEYSDIPDMFSDIRPGFILPKIRDRIGPMGPVRRKIMPRLNMASSFLAREDIFDLENHTAVDTIYTDEFVYAFSTTGFSTVPDEHHYAMGEEPTQKEFTDTTGTRKMLGVDQANEAGFAGEGITVAVSDTAGRHQHPQTNEHQFDSAMVQRRDNNGHGVWCSTAIFGSRWRNERLSSEADDDVVNEGMVPNADGYGIKSLGYVMGMGNNSDILQSVEMAIEQGADVLNLSLGGPVSHDDPEDDPFYPAMEKALENGCIPVAAAGNSGPAPQTVGSPGWLPNVLSVGATDALTGDVTEFSSRGPTPDGRIKPDVVAPGANVDSGITGLLDASGDQVVSRSAFIDGTSMAAPHVSGIVAIMKQIFQTELETELTLDEIFAMMEEYGENDEKSPDSGWGELNMWVVDDYLTNEHGITLDLEDQP